MGGGGGRAGGGGRGSTSRNFEFPDLVSNLHTGFQTQLRPKWPPNFLHTFFVYFYTHLKNNFEKSERLLWPHCKTIDLFLDWLVTSLFYVPQTQLRKGLREGARSFSSLNE